MHRTPAMTAPLMLALVILCATPGGSASQHDDAAVSERYIVRAASARASRDLVTEAGGRVTAMLNIIDAVGAELTEEQIAWLQAQPDVISISRDAALEVSGDVAETHYPVLVGATDLHAQGITGKGINIAVLDTGLWLTATTEFGADGSKRIVAQYDATLDDVSTDDDDYDDGWSGWSRILSYLRSFRSDISDWNGHGTHVASVMAGSGRTAAGHYQGVAPDAGIVAVRAFDADGSGSYINVVKALDWIVSHRNHFDIRVLNLSFGAPPASHYWDDPVNLAVMAAWQSGIVVVAAGGNGGPGPMTVGVPGNVPYVITVGAITDNFTPQDTSDDRLATFSAAGPTFEGFVKPEIVAPGGHMLGKMPPYGWLPLSRTEYALQTGDNYEMSGTSQAAAVVSGVIVLMLQLDPNADPDGVKCRIMASARPALRADGNHAYSVFQQGAGLVDAVAAIGEPALDCANRAMNIGDDIAGTEHYAGPSGVDMAGTYYLVDSSGTRLSGPEYEWNNGSLWPEGALWPSGSPGTQGALWNEGVIWNEQPLLNGDSLMSQGALWPEGSLWNEGLTRSVSTYIWVDEE